MKNYKGHRVMQIQDIRDDECVQDFLRSRRIRNSTKKEYVQRIKTYSSFLDKTPTELIDEAEEEEEAGIKKRKRKIKKYFYDFVEYLEKDREVSEQTIQLHISTITAFYDEHDITPPRVKGLHKTISNISFDKLPSFDDVKKATVMVGPRDKAIILLMISSGMGSSEVRNLKITDFKTSRSKIRTWNIRRFKTGMPYYTFNSPQSTEALNSYLKTRKKKNTSDYLFVNKSNMQMSNDSITRLFHKANDGAGLGFRDHRHRTLTSHILRKMFTTALYKAGLDILQIDWMLGHKIPVSRAAYFKTHPDELKETYKKVIEFITL